MSSQPGAAYTIFLDFSGFNYSGMWFDATPGITPAYGDVAANGAFTPQLAADIKAAWAGVAMQYAGFNVNVTTVDPATGANAATDVARQTFYGNTPNLMHTVIGSALRDGGTTQWTGSAGISFQGTTTGTDTSANGEGHTNWVVTTGLGYTEVGNVHYIAQDASHENGHGLGLGHQSDYVGTTLVNDYGLGDTMPDPSGRPAAAGGANRVASTLRLAPELRHAAKTAFVGPLPAVVSSTGPGTYGSIMGDGNFAQRLAFRVGSTSDGGTGALQNDVGRILSTNTAANAASQGRTGGVDLHLKEDGIGHTMATATTLPLSGLNVNFNLASGVIVPNSETNPQPIGKANYTTDFFRFTLAATSTLTLTAHDGSQFVTPGVADSQVTLRSTMQILSAAGFVVGTATEAADTLSETFSGALAAGTYFIQVQSFGGHAEVDAPGTNFNASNMYDMGSYFLTGSGFNVVPEPGTWAMIILGAGLLVTVQRACRIHRA